MDLVQLVIHGWSAPSVYLTIIVGVLSLDLVNRSTIQTETNQCLDFRVYKYPMFALSSAISVTLSIAMFSAMLLMPIYLQNIRGISAMDSGLLMLPGALIMGIMMPITGKIFDKFGPKLLAYIGLAIVIVTTYLFSQLTDSTGYTHLVVLYSVRMFGISMVMMPDYDKWFKSNTTYFNPTWYSYEQYDSTSVWCYWR